MIKRVGWGCCCLKAMQGVEWLLLETVSYCSLATLCVGGGLMFSSPSSGTLCGSGACFTRLTVPIACRTAASGAGGGEGQMIRTAGCAYFVPLSVLASSSHNILPTSLVSTEHERKRKHPGMEAISLAPVHTGIQIIEIF